MWKPISEWPTLTELFFGKGKTVAEEPKKKAPAKPKPVTKKKAKKPTPAKKKAVAKVSKPKKVATKKPAAKKTAKKPAKK